MASDGTSLRRVAMEWCLWWSPCLLLLLGTTGGQELVKPDIRALEIRSEVKYRYARTEVYSLIANPSNASQEVTFRAVLPEAAFISGLAITDARGRVTVASVQGREQARETFAAAAREGRTAARAEATNAARDARFFTVALHVAAGEKAAFNLTYEQLLGRERGRYSLRHMLDPGQVVQRLLVEVKISDSRPLTLVRAASLRALDNEVDPSAQDTDDPLATVLRPSPTEALVRWTPDAEAQASLSDGTGAGLEGLLEIQFDVQRDGGDGGESELVIGDGGYFVHFFAPPEHELPPLPKHAVFVLDTSGSMSGTKIRQLKEAMAAILSELREADAFSVELFATGASVWSSESRLFQEVRDLERPLPSGAVVNATHASAAQEAINTTRAFGATHMHTALRVAYELVKAGRRSAPRRLPLLFFLTDGQPNGPNSSLDELQALVEEEKQSVGGVAPLYCLAFGAEADFQFLKRMSRSGGGFARRVYEAADAALQLRQLYTTVASPLLTNVTFLYADDQVDTQSLTRAAFPVHLAGAELTVAGRLRGGGGEGAAAAEDDVQLAARVEGDAVDGRSNVSTATVQRRLPPRSASFVERLWAYLTIRQLLEQGEGDDAGARERALQLALRYSFVTPLTSLVAVGEAAQPMAVRTALGDGRRPPPSHSGAPGSPMAAQTSKRMGPPIGAPGSPMAAQAFNRMGPVSGASGSLMAAHTFDRMGPPRGRMRSRGKSQHVTIEPGRIRDASGVSDANLTSMNHPREKVPLSEFQWLQDGVSGNGTHLYVADGATGALRAYLVVEPPDFDWSSEGQSGCTVSVAGRMRAGFCVPLAKCALKIFAQSFPQYTAAFCSIRTSFAGACCPEGWEQRP